MQIIRLTKLAMPNPGYDSFGNEKQTIFLWPNHQARVCIQRPNCSNLITFAEYDEYWHNKIKIN
jgi:hypothetical protein